MKHPLLSFFAAVGLALSSIAATVVIPASADTTLNEANSDNNMGGHTHLAVGTTTLGTFNRALLRFDLTGKVPAGNTITSVQLKTTVIFVPPGASASEFAVHRMLQSWSEGNKTGNRGEPATAGETTWNMRAHPTTAWSAAGGASDAAAEPSALTPVNFPGAYTLESTAALVADVQAWLENPASNHGWLLKTVDEIDPHSARRVGSRETVGGGVATLEITYSNQPSELKITSFRREPGAHILTWTGGLPPYSVEHRSGLGLPWEFAAPAGSATELRIPGAFPSPVLFYRVVGANP